MNKTKRFYIQTSAVKSDYEVTDGGVLVTSGEDIDYGVLVGWARRFSNGLVIEISYNYLRLDSTIKIKFSNFGLNYRFLLFQNQTTMKYINNQFMFMSLFSDSRIHPLIIRYTNQILATKITR